MNKNLRRAIMERSKLKNKANKTKNPLDRMNCKKTTHLYEKVKQNSKTQQYFNNLKLGKDNKPFREK